MKTRLFAVVIIYTAFLIAKCSDLSPLPDHIRHAIGSDFSGYGKTYSVEQ
jgi:hypothetical protein